MATDCAKSHWPAPSRVPDPDAFRPSREPNETGGWVGSDWHQSENGKIVRYVNPPVVEPRIDSDWPDLSNCVAIW